jgi:hypothetical protein
MECPCRSKSIEKRSIAGAANRDVTRRSRKSLREVNKTGPETRMKSELELDRRLACATMGDTKADSEKY